MPEFKTIAALFREQLEEGTKPIGVGLKMRRQLKQDGSGFVAEQRQPVLQNLKAIDRVLREAFPFGDEFGCLPGEDKIFAGLLAPAFDGLGRRGTIKRAVKLSRGELAGVVLKLVFDRQSLGKERPTPGIVMPSRRADQNACHGITASLPSCLSNPLPSRTPNARPRRMIWFARVLQNSRMTVPSRSAPTAAPDCRVAATPAFPRRGRVSPFAPPISEREWSRHRPWSAPDRGDGPCRHAQARSGQDRESDTARRGPLPPPSRAIARCGRRPRASTASLKSLRGLVQPRRQACRAGGG